VHAFRGKEFVEYDNPYDVGMTGLIGFSLSGQGEELVELGKTNLRDLEAE
jgi:hypothetical protein